MPKKINSSQNVSAAKTTALLCAAVLIFSLSLFFFRLGDRPFRNPDEGRYAAIAREMVESGDWGVPTLFGLAYLKKPILFYWLIAGSFKLFGVNEWTARLVPAIFGIMGVCAVFWFCLRYYGRRIAWMASLMVATNFWYLQVGRYLVIDMVFSFFLVMAAFSFYVANSSTDPRLKRYYILFFGLMGCAFLTKGPVSLVVTGLPILIYLWSSKRFVRTVMEMRWFSGILLFALVALPWFVWVAIRQPHFLELFFGHENWNRVFSSSFEHQEPWYFYVLVLIPMMMPWILFWRPLLSIRGASEDRPDPRFFLMVCGLTTVLFYSLAKAKLATYILPTVIFWMIPLAYGWDRWIHEPQTTRSWREVWPVVVMMMVGVGLIVVSPWYVLERSHGKYPSEVVADFQLLGGALLAGGVFCAKSLRQNRRGRLFYSLITVMALVSFVFPHAMETMNPTYSTKAFAQKLGPLLKSEDEVYVFDQPGAFYDFGFYLDHPVKLVGLEGELEFSRQDEKAGAVSVTRDEFDRMLKERSTLYCLSRKSDYADLAPEIRQGLMVVHEDKRKVLFRSGPSEEII